MSIKSMSVAHRVHVKIICRQRREEDKSLATCKHGTIETRSTCTVGWMLCGVASETPEHSHHGDPGDRRSTSAAAAGRETTKAQEKRTGREGRKANNVPSDINEY